MSWVFSSMVKEQSWFTLQGSVYYTLNVLKNNTVFYLAALDPRKLFPLSEMYVQITLCLQMSTGEAQDAYTFSVQEDVEHQYVHQDLELIALIQYFMEHPFL